MNYIFNIERSTPMKKLTRTDFIQPFIFLDEENKPIVPSEIKKYLLLIEFSESSDTPVEQERTYAVIEGRGNAAKEIIKNLPDLYGEDSINWFKSMIISDSQKISDGISFYSFIRMLLENNMLAESDWNNIIFNGSDEGFDLSVWNEFILDKAEQIIELDPIDPEFGEDTYEARIEAFYRWDLYGDEEENNG
jgi:hypothetical protein